MNLYYISVTELLSVDYIELSATLAFTGLPYI